MDSNLSRDLEFFSRAQYEIVYIHKGSFITRFKSYKEAGKFLQEMNKRNDVYLRLKDSGYDFLFADLDHGLPKDIDPDWLIKTSPGKYQALWRTKSKLKQEEWIRHQKDIIKKTGSDSCVSNPDIVIRLPNCYNHKRDCYIERII